MSEPARDLEREARLKEARVMVAGSERVKNREKNRGKWDAEALWFDKDGCLFIDNPELAKEIESVMNAWGNRLRIYRWEGDSKRPATRSLSDKGKGDGTGETSEAGHPVNMMCPCTSEG